MRRRWIQGGGHRRAMRRTVYIILLALSAGAGVGAAHKPPRAHELHTAYSHEEYATAFGKRYAGEAARKVAAANFAASLGKILAHNSKPGTSWKMGLNHMSDWSPEERAALNGFKSSGALPAEDEDSKEIPGPSSSAAAAATLPAELDWRACTPFSEGGSLRSLCPLVALPAEPVVTPPKFQGNCGSCWAFGTAQAVESAFALKAGWARELAPQQLVSCVHSFEACDGRGGCTGADPKEALEYLMGAQKVLDPKRNGSDLVVGLVDEWSYGYTSGDALLPGVLGQSPSSVCRFDKIKAGVDPEEDIIGHTGAVALSGYTVSRNNYTELQSLLASKGPPVTIMAMTEDFVHYESGVYTNCGYNATDSHRSMPLNHAVQLVGYGTDAATGLDYWTVRNSFSSVWGDHGYFRVLREAETTCGVTRSIRTWCHDEDDAVVTPTCGCTGIATVAYFPTIGDLAVA